MLISCGFPVTKHLRIVHISGTLNLKFSFSQNLDLYYTTLYSRKHQGIRNLWISCGFPVTCKTSQNSSHFRHIKFEISFSQKFGSILPPVQYTTLYSGKCEWKLQISCIFPVQLQASFLKKSYYGTDHISNCTLLKKKCHSDTHGVSGHPLTNDTPKGVSGCHENLWSLSLKTEFTEKQYILFKFCD